VPNYPYRCVDCYHPEKVTLPISSDPSETYTCRMCGGDMTRRIGTPSVVEKKQTLGKWYKEQTGKDLLGDKC
jgi:putative FmdB family regulatory protein